MNLSNETMSALLGGRHFQGVRQGMTLIPHPAKAFDETVYLYF